MNVINYLKEFKNQPGFVFGISMMMILFMALMLRLTISFYEDKSRIAERDALWEASLQPPLSEIDCNNVDQYYDRCFHLLYESHIPNCKDRLLPKVFNCQHIGVDQ